MPASNLDRPAEFSIQVGFIVISKNVELKESFELSQSIPRSEDVVYINFIWEQENPGSEGMKHVWPTAEKYRPIFVEILVNILSNSIIEIPHIK